MKCEKEKYSKDADRCRDWQDCQKELRVKAQKNDSDNDSSNKKKEKVISSLISASGMTYRVVDLHELGQMNCY